MTSTNVTPAAPDREVITADKLHDHIGEWIHHTKQDRVVLVRYASQAGADGLVVTVLQIGGYERHTILKSDEPVALATDDEIQTAADQQKRGDFADALEAFAAVLRDHPNLPMSDRNPSMSLGYHMSRDDLVKVGNLLGITPEHSYDRTFGVEWRAFGQPDFGSFHVTWSAQYPLCVVGEKLCCLYDGHDGNHVPPRTQAASVKPKQA